MPLHDWSRVEENVFHNFHASWTHWLMRALNQGILPAGYLARMEEYAGPYQTDLLTLELGSGELGSGELGSGRASPASARTPRPAPTATIAPARFGARRQRRVSVFSAREERRVSVVELVSPGNKDSTAKAGWFEAKLVDYLAGGLHVLVLDVLPPTGPAPGFGAAVAAELGAAGQVPAGGRCATSFERAGAPDVVRVYHQPLRLGQPLPTAPLFLEPDYAVDVRLEETYAEAFASLPAVDRELLG